MMVPYLEARGFPGEFLESEGELSLKAAACACTYAVLSSSELQNYPVFMAKGSLLDMKMTKAYQMQRLEDHSCPD